MVKRRGPRTKETGTSDERNEGTKNYAYRVVRAGKLGGTLKIIFHITGILIKIAKLLMLTLAVLEIGEFETRQISNMACFGLV